MEPKCRSHKDLVLWRKALDLAGDVHEITAAFPRSELFGLVSQIRRAAVSVPSNIAEGAARRSTREFAAYLHIARGSLAELDTQLLLSRRAGYLAEADVARLMPKAEEVGRMLTATLHGLRRKVATSGHAHR